METNLSITMRSAFEFLITAIQTDIDTAKVTRECDSFNLRLILWQNWIFLEATGRYQLFLKSKV